MSKAEANAYLEIAADTLAAAEVLLAKGFWRRSLSEAYFSVHQAVRGALAARGIEVRTHRGAIKELRGAYADRLDLDLLRNVARLQEVRQNSDYEAAFEVLEGEARDAVSEARRFLAWVTAALQGET